MRRKKTCLQIWLWWKQYSLFSFCSFASMLVSSSVSTHLLWISRCCLYISSIEHRVYFWCEISIPFNNENLLIYFGRSKSCLMRSVIGHSEQLFFSQSFTVFPLVTNQFLLKFILSRGSLQSDCRRRYLRAMWADNRRHVIYPSKIKRIANSTQS